MPKNQIKIPIAEAKNLIDIATVRLEMKKIWEFGEIEDANLEIITWFLTVTSDSEKRKLIFANKSMQK